ncbi:hypothetical protein [Nonomuraea sp. NPDC050202]|uniref:hypothetical protein n=1 Tax=Nonomuraea sp. NPDC050202 TaxID=3155035 RepID=UPI0033EA64FF
MTTSTTTVRPHGLRLWWSILLLSTTVSITLNLWHALTMKADQALVRDACQVSDVLCERATQLAAKVVGIHPVLGIIFAIVPPVFAALLSHGLISPLVGEWIKRAILTLFGVSMATSIASQAAVMRPYGGGYWAEWAIPLVLDASQIIALHVITTAASLARKAAEAAASAAETEAAKTGLRPLVEAEVRAELGAELSQRKAELEAEVERNRQAELTAARAEERAEVEAELETRISARLSAAAAEFRTRAEAEKAVAVQRAEVAAEARVRREIAEQAKQSGQRRASAPSARRDTEDGLSSEDRARILLAQNPEMTGAELGRALGLTERYGRDLLKKIQDGVPDGPEPPPDNLRFLSVGSGS